MAAPAEIQKLVERFDLHRDDYTSHKYNETQIRREFVDPFFRALGWDVDNEAGFAEAYKDVVHEDSIKIGKETKAPDYSFRVGGVRKFFVETKKPSVNLKDDTSPAFQLRRYAWSAKLPLSILTDFEEFVVYDCRVRPAQTDKPATARILYVRYDEFDDRWDEIASVFGKDQVYKGSFDRFAESKKKKKGTAEVDDAFLDEIEAWRNELARNLAARNAELSQRQVNFAVQRTIDRIIFLRICEDRGIEQYARLRGLVNGPNIYPRLCELFRQADDRYNSGLFHFHKEKERPEPADLWTLDLKIDDKLLKRLIGHLYYPDSPYEFSVIGSDILGQVYEQFLGKVIRLTKGHRAVVEDKPEVKKAGGVYYTPTYIVDYIVENTVGKLLEGKTPRQAEKLKILDPACGSGSFLIGAYQYLLDWHRDYYLEREPAKKKKQLYKTHKGEWRLTTTERKRILLNNVYGVDIDPQAVEVTKLSLLLKVLEGETSETLQRSLFARERALPDLGHNVKCGNSLIGPDFYDNQQLEFFDEEERLRINVFDWASEFPQVFPSPAGRGVRGEGLSPRHGRGAVGEGAGFDAVIGNPPYGAYFYEEAKAYLNSKYSCQDYQLDSYLLFLERAINKLLSLIGFFGMIIPNPWLTNLRQKKIRVLVTTKTHIRKLVHFRFPVFRKVTVDTQIVVLQKGGSEESNVEVSIVKDLDAFHDDESSNENMRLIHRQDRWRELEGQVINIFLSEEEDLLKKKIENRSIRLDSICKINVGIKPYQTGKGEPPQTRAVVKSRPFDSNKPLSPEFRSYLRGKDIRRYIIDPIESRYIKYGPWLAEPRPGANFDAQLKLFMRQTGDSLVAALDDQQFLCLNNMHVIVPEAEFPSPYYVLGILNSCLLNWYYHTLNPEVGEALAEVKKANVARLPIRKVTSSIQTEQVIHDRMVELVEQILALHRQLLTAKTGHEQTALRRQIETTDAQIDRLVYNLYDLKDDEIAIMKGATQ